jgi:hypothetical protein
MEGVKRSIIALLIVLWPAVSYSQNWMMVQRYLTSAIDTIIQINWPNTGKLNGYSIDRVEYDSIFKDFLITFTDTICYNKLDLKFKTEETPDCMISSGELSVGIKGGDAILKEENGDVTYLELPDLSRDVYIYNDSGREVSFEISNDDLKFETYKLIPGKFNYISSSGSGFVFIKIETVVKGKEARKVHYKLSKMKGYKVKFDLADSKFEVYLDERLDILDFEK